MRTFDCREVEQMDHPQADSAEMEVTLRELENLNRRFGGHGYARRFLARRFKEGGSYRVLDVATGGGDYPRAMVDWARSRNIRLRVDAIDASPVIVELARKFSAGYGEIRYQQGDALSFHAEEEYDLVHCSLSLHHFSASDAVRLLQRCRALSREYVLVTDLQRSWLARIGVRLVNVLFGHHPMTLSDGDTSTRRAFSFREFRILAKGARWPSFGHERFPFFRQALWLPAKAGEA